MTKLYKNKYRRQTHRAQWWDYTNNGFYFVTIGTRKREHFFGEINKGSIILSETGKIANDLWYEIPNHQPSVRIDEFIVMPNHIHGIIIIKKPVDYNNTDGVDGFDNVAAVTGTNTDMDTDTSTTVGGSIGVGVVATRHASSLQPHPQPQQFPPQSILQQQKKPIRNQNTEGISPQKGSLSIIIGGYKSAVTKNVRKINPNFNWQPRFYDHIIRNEQSLEQIRYYIRNNPHRWDRDTFNK